ncbi:hypothetical protein [Glutamicibacter sp. Je.9.36]|uniref:hypothetical protein n=1 Tax=Glutamicibacter sp. Je.9.36 TaxID=3142837 RepID=UPI003DA9A08D
MINTEFRNAQIVGPQKDYSHLVFARGYLITDNEQALPSPHWERFEINGLHLAYDPRIQLAHATNGKCSITLLGHAIDLVQDTSNTTQIVKSLLENLNESRSDYFKELENLSGRYIIIDSGPKGTWIQSDAVALRSIYWNAESRIIASHQNLVAETAGGLAVSVFGSAKWRSSNKAFSYPGNESHWEGVKFLNANHQLNIETFEYSRIPMSAPEPASLNEVAQRVLKMMRVQLKHLLKYPNPVVSLTAGQDSRTTLAALRPVKNSFHYFTYALNYSRRLRAVKLDANDSVRIAKEMGLEHHHLMNIEGPLENEKLARVLSRNSPKASNRNVAERYLIELENDTMHIRSSFNEVAIAAYRTKYAPSVVTPEVLSDILTFETGYTIETLRATSSYMETTGILEVPGYDPLDLYYWELRMGSWLGNISHESDIAFDTHILINSRSIIRTLLSAPAKERGKGNIYHRIIQIAWPELYSIPVNSVLQEFPETTVVDTK